MRVTGRVHIYETRISGLFRMTGSVYEWNKQKAREVAGAASLTAPKGRTLNLAASHSVQQNRDVVGRYQSAFSVENNARNARGIAYARYVAKGTGIYGPQRRYIVYRKPVGPLPAPGPRFITSQRGQRPNNWLARAANMVFPFVPPLV